MQQLLLQNTKKSTVHQWEYTQTSHISTQPQDLFKGPEEQIKLNKIWYTASEAVNE